MNKKQQMLANMKATFAKQGDGQSGDSSYSSNKNAQVNEMLQTKKEAIGMTTMYPRADHTQF